MPEPKTKPTTTDPREFLETITPDGKRLDAYRLLEMFEKATNEKPVMWGPAIIGFGNYSLKYSNGTTADWPLVGFSPRKQYLTLYVMPDPPEEIGNKELFKKLGKFTTSKACLYIKKLSDVDEYVLANIIKNSYEHSKRSKLQSLI